MNKKDYSFVCVGVCMCICIVVTDNLLLTLTLTAMFILFAVVSCPNPLLKTFVVLLLYPSH